MLKKIIVALALVLVLAFGFNFLYQELNSQTAEATVTDCDSMRNALFRQHVREIYDNAGLSEADMPFKLFYKGMTGYYNLTAEGQVDKPVLSVIDFRKPSSEKRLWVVDLDSQKLLFHSLVAHGRGSGDSLAQHFSNTAQSYQSSIGFYVTSTRYSGSHGTSLVLEGMEEGYNDNARERAIVIHGADYVSKNFVEAVGRLGRSHGCPAVPNEICEDLVCTICDRSALFIYYPLKGYDKQSRYLKLPSAVSEFMEDKPAPCPAPDLAME